MSSSVGLRASSAAAPARAHEAPRRWTESGRRLYNRRNPGRTKHDAVTARFPPKRFAMGAVLVTGATGFVGAAVALGYLLISLRMYLQVLHLYDPDRFPANEPEAGGFHAVE